MTTTARQGTFAELTADPVFRKRRAIKEVVEGKSFVDVGGLWGTKGEMVTVAASAGAAELTMADIHQQPSIWWTRFEERCAERGVSGYNKTVVDICAPDAPQTLGSFDVVHCSGVMYHVPDLLQFIRNLASISRDYLIVGSVTLPDRIDGPEGDLDTDDDEAVFVPHLSKAKRRIIVDHYTTLYTKQGWKFNAGGLTDDSAFFDPDGTPRYGPWWWLFTAGFMCRMVEAHGFEILGYGPNPEQIGSTLIARKRTPAS